MANLYQNNPYIIEQEQQAQQQQFSPAQALQMYQQFSGGGSGGLSGIGGAESVASTGSGGNAASGLGSTIISSPIGLVAAGALAQNIAHNKGISSWQAGLKGQGARNVGDYAMEKTGLDDDLSKTTAGLVGWGSGAGYFNPANVMAKIFGETD